MGARRQKAVLVQTVGTGGERNPVWKALAFAVRERRPDVVVQLCSEKTSAETVPKFEAELAGERLPEMRRRVCADPDDVDALTIEYIGEIDRLRSEFPQARIEVDFTSGTKPMSAAAVAAGVARQVAALHYAVGPRDESGRAVATSKLCTIGTERLIAERELRELGRLFNIGEFAAVAAQAERWCKVLSDRRLRAQADSLTFLAEVYGLWDRFNWKGAFAELRKYQHMKSLAEAGWQIEVLGRQVKHLHDCKDSAQRAERLADLLANARRCVERGRFDDAIARLYRLCEYTMQLRFAKRFGVKNSTNPTKVEPAVLERRAPLLAEKLAAGTPAGEKLALGLRKTIAALAEAGDAFAAELNAQYGDGPEGRKRQGRLVQLLERRSQSWLAHGIEPIPRACAEELLGLAEVVVQRHCQEAGIELGSLLETATFARCPWAEA